MLHPLLWQVFFGFFPQPRVNDLRNDTELQVLTGAVKISPSTIRCYFTCADPLDEIRSLQLPLDQLRGAHSSRPSVVVGVARLRCFMIA